MAMEITSWLPIILGIVGLLGLLMVSGKIGGEKPFRQSKSPARSFLTLVMAGLLIYGGISFAIQGLGLDLGTANSAFLAVAGTEVPTPPPTSGGEAIPPEPVAKVQEKGLVVNTLTLTEVKEKGSNKYDQITGALWFYPSGTDPKSANANAIDVIGISSGAGSSTNKTLRTGTPYRVVFKGGGTYYDKDFGEYIINNYNPNTGEAPFVVGEVATVATISAFFTEPRNSSINGQTSLLVGTDEIGNTTSDILVYDESVGNEEYYLDVILGFTGGNQYIKKPVFCFEDDLANPPEGTEHSAITSSTRSGDRYALPSDLLGYWKDELCVALPTSDGDYEKAGSSTTVRITFNPTEANLDADDDFFFLIDDLGEARGKDDGLNTGVAIQRQGIDAQA